MLIWAPKHVWDIVLAIGQHLVLSASSAATGLLLALLIGLASVGRPRIYSVAITVANLIFVIPSLHDVRIADPAGRIGIHAGFHQSVGLLPSDHLAKRLDRVTEHPNGCPRGR